MTPHEIKRIIEALILCHDAPMSLASLKEALATDLNNDALRLLLDEIKIDWSERAIHLTQVATGYRFQTAPDMVPYVDRLRAEKPVQYSRAVLETLAIIAYRQPVTRGDIEDIRGVTVSSNIIKNLEERGWIDAVGHREVPGRPALFATTKQFLNDLGLISLKELPALIGQADAETGQLELVAHSDDEAGSVDETELQQMTETLAPLTPQISDAEADSDMNSDKNSNANSDNNTDAVVIQISESSAETDSTGDDTDSAQDNNMQLNDMQLNDMQLNDMQPNDTQPN